MLPALKMEKEYSTNSPFVTDNHIKTDWKLDKHEDRVEKVKEIIKNTPPEKLNSTYLDKLGEYIVAPITKEEKKQYYLLTANRMTTINGHELSFEGLLTKFENGEDGVYNLITDNNKNDFYSPKKEITQNDIDTIPGLKELREAIIEIERQAKEATGRRKYLLIQQLKQMRKDQYVLKSSFKQPVYSKNIIRTLAKLNLDEKITVAEDGEPASTGVINLFEPAHVTALLSNYSALKEETWDKFDSDMHYLLIDLEKLIDKAIKDRFPLLYDLLIYKIDGKQNLEIQTLLLEKHGIKHTVEYISALWKNKIPKLICEEAKREWLEWHYTAEECGKWKKCGRCGQIKLAHPYFFTRNNASKDHFYSICKECRNKATKAKRD